jgi:glucuronate isomerase
MSLELRNRLYAELSGLTLIDPHTHINPHQPASQTLADILGYHYYTELAHSAGMPREQIEEDGLDPREKVRRLMENLGPLENTIQVSWLVEMARAFFGFQEDRLTADNWEAVYDAASEKMAGDDWSGDVLRQSKLEAVFLTNDFDDELDGFDTSVYIPCLRTDDLVFQLAKDSVRERLERVSNVSVNDAGSLRRAIRSRFVHFRRKGARACAISLPPDFSPTHVSTSRADSAIEAIWREGADASEAHRRAAANWVFWTLAELCDEFRLPFDLMIGVNRSVYPGGVFQGMDLYDSRVSLIQYRELFNAFPRVVFPVSVLASVTNQELTSYAWIFPNVVTNGHWWYSNTPTFIEHDASARLEAVPRTKQIGYYSDMYKLEFALPKFNMYKRILAKILAERFVLDRGWSEEQALDLGRQVLRGNVEQIFQWNEPIPEISEEAAEDAPLGGWAAAAETAKQTPYDEPAVAGEYTYWPQATEDEGEEFKFAEDSPAEEASAFDAELEQAPPSEIPLSAEDEAEEFRFAEEESLARADDTDIDVEEAPSPESALAAEGGDEQFRFAEEPATDVEPVAGDLEEAPSPESALAAEEPPAAPPPVVSGEEETWPFPAPQNVAEETFPAESAAAEPGEPQSSAPVDVSDSDDALEAMDIDVVEEDLDLTAELAADGDEDDEELSLDLSDEDEEVVDLSEEFQLEEEERPDQR